MLIVKSPEAVSFSFTELYSESQLIVELSGRQLYCFG